MSDLTRDLQAIEKLLRDKGIAPIGMSVQDFPVDLGNGFLRDTGVYMTQVLVDKKDAKLALVYLSAYHFELFLSERSVDPSLKYNQEEHTVFVYRSYGQPPLYSEIRPDE